MKFSADPRLCHNCSGGAIRFNDDTVYTDKNTSSFFVIGQCDTCDKEYKQLLDILIKQKHLIPFRRDAMCSNCGEEMGVVRNTRKYPNCNCWECSNCGHVVPDPGICKNT